MARIKLLFFVLTIFLLSTNVVIGNKITSLEEDDVDRIFMEFEEFREWKKEKDNFESRKMISRKDKTTFDIISGSFKKNNKHWINNESLKTINDTISMARFVVNQANWSSIATISSRDDIESYPFANVVSVSDGLLGNGSGIPYTYLTPLDFTSKDIEKDHRATMLMSLAQGHWCEEKLMDPMDPRCARITLTGKIQKILPDDQDYEIAKNAVFNRHPWLATMPPNHHFYFAKLKIESIVLLDAFGGPKYIDVEQYLDGSVEDFSIKQINDLSKYVYQV